LVLNVSVAPEGTVHAPEASCVKVADVETNVVLPLASFAWRYTNKLKSLSAVVAPTIVLLSIMIVEVEGRFIVTLPTVTLEVPMPDDKTLPLNDVIAV